MHSQATSKPRSAISTGEFPPAVLRSYDQDHLCREFMRWSKWHVSRHPASPFTIRFELLKPDRSIDQKGVLGFSPDERAFFKSMDDRIVQAMSQCTRELSLPEGCYEAIPEKLKDYKKNCEDLSSQLSDAKKQNAELSQSRQVAIDQCSAEAGKLKLREVELLKFERKLKDQENSLIVREEQLRPKHAKEASQSLSLPSTSTGQPRTPQGNRAKISQMVQQVHDASKNVLIEELSKKNDELSAFQRSCKKALEEAKSETQTYKTQLDGMKELVIVEKQRREKAELKLKETKHKLTKSELELENVQLQKAKIDTARKKTRTSLTIKGESSAENKDKTLLEQENAELRQQINSLKYTNSLLNEAAAMSGGVTVPGDWVSPSSISVSRTHASAQTPSVQVSSHVDDKARNLLAKRQTNRVSQLQAELLGVKAELEPLRKEQARFQSLLDEACEYFESPPAKKQKTQPTYTSTLHNTHAEQTGYEQLIVDIRPMPARELRSFKSTLSTVETACGRRLTPPCLPVNSVSVVSVNSAVSTDNEQAGIYCVKESSVKDQPVFEAGAFKDSILMGYGYHYHPRPTRQQMKKRTERDHSQTVSRRTIAFKKPSC